MTKRFQAGQQVICNGHKGVIKMVHDGQLRGMADVRLERGSVCVSLSDLELENPGHTAASTFIDEDDTEG